MSESEGKTERRSRSTRRFPWFVLILLIGSIYAFWVLPHQLPDRPVKVDFVERPTTTR